MNKEYEKGYYDGYEGGYEEGKEARGECQELSDIANEEGYMEAVVDMKRQVAEILGRYKYTSSKKDLHLLEVLIGELDRWLNE